MDFIFMLTHGDKTVSNCEEVLDISIKAGVSHIGFKDVGVNKATLRKLAETINAAGLISYMEVVSTTEAGILESIETAVDIGIKRILGGQNVKAAMEIIGDSESSYYPFPGTPVGHPTKLGGTAAQVTADCERMVAQGCSGADLLAYRATDADPLDLIRAARAGLGDGYLVVAGSIDSPARIKAIAEAGADAFTIGTAAFDFTFTPGIDSIYGQLKSILTACETV